MKTFLHIQYRNNLLQHILFAFYKNFDTHCHMFIYMYILLRNKILLLPKWLQKPACPILYYSSVVNIVKTGHG